MSSHGIKQPQVARGRGVMQLVDALEGRIAQKGDRQPMPPEFMEQFAARFEGDGLPDLMNIMGE